ncbi:MAG: hypothetical protein HZC28_15370 [Spirochaetes bacterium]|nr:hypothetical protein [Spirochaetota bacterium]
MRIVTSFFFALALVLTAADDTVIRVSLDTADGLWQHWGPKSSGIEFAGGYNGKPSLRGAFPDEESVGGTVSKNIAITENTTYTVSLFARGKGTLNLQLFQYDAAKKAVKKDYHSLGTLSADWKEYSKLLVTTNSAETMTFNFLFYKSGGKFEIADIRLIPQAANVQIRIPSPRRAGADGPVAWWTFDSDDCAGLTTYDRAGDCHGDLSEGASPATGRFNGGISFNGKSGSVVMDGAPLLGQNFTIMAWFKTDDLKSVRWYSIYAGDVKGCQYLRINDDGRPMLLRADIAAVASAKTPVTAGAWHHVAVTYSVTGAYAFYIDGADAGSGTVTHQPFVDPDHASLGMVAAGGPPRPMRGILDDVRVYDRTLTAAEIASLASTTPSPPAAAGRRSPTLTMQITPAADDNWFTLGTPVVFRINGDVVRGITGLHGMVYDARGKELASVTLPRERFTDGWSWMPPYQGFFEIKFFMVTAAGNTPLVWKYRNQTSKGTGVSFTRDAQAVAVMPPAPKQKRRQFGFSYGNGGDPELRLAANLGLSFVRWHCIPWGALFVDETLAVEPSRGNYRWNITDPHVELFKKYGFAPDEIVGNVIFTPAWASPHPEDTKIEIGVMGKNAYAPVKDEYFADFLRALVGRYGKSISVWELWNEPHLPGGSIFWKDSPENFAKMITAGYQAVKAVQPNSEVWIGGMGGKRYLPFYREFLKAGGAPFDRIPMHGSWQDISGFRKLEQEFDKPSVPWVSSEWHGILVSAMQTPPSEANLARRLLLDLADQLKNGVERTALFCMREGNSEKELMPAAYADGSFQQSFGMFRSRPRPEPRLAAVAIRVFIDQITARLEFGGQSELGGTRLIWFIDGTNTLTLLWSEDTSSAAPDRRIASALNTARIVTMEGYPVTTASFMLEPERVYLAGGMPRTLLAALPANSDPLNPDLRRPKIEHPVPSATYVKTPILDASRNIIDEASLAWISRDWNYIKVNDDRQQSFKARYAASIGTHGIDLVVDVKDAVFNQQEKFPAFWTGDSVQFALDVDGAGIAGNQTEFITARSSEGAVISKVIAASIGGDLPQRWTPANRPLAFGGVTIDPTADGMRYRIHVDATELYPFSYSPNSIIRFSILVNNNDGRVRAGYLEWSSGIGAAKDAGLYGKLTQKE